MGIAIVVNILAIFFAFLESKKVYRRGLLISFIILFLFLAFRYDYGNDYVHYYEGFEEINRYVSFDIYDEDIHFEPGWVLLCRYFNPFGFFSLIIFLSFLYCVVFYNFIKKYVPSNLYWMAVFILVFSSENMMIHLSAMRQTLVIIIFLFSLRFIHKGQFIKYFLFILLASTFHSSALLLLPVYFVRNFNFKFNSYIIVFVFTIYVGLYLYAQQLAPLINSLVNTFNDGYTVYDESSTIGSGWGLILNGLLFLIILFHDKYYEGEKSVLFKIAILSFLIAPLVLIIMMISRVSMYFSVYLIGVYPLVFNVIKQPVVKVVFTGVLFFMVLLSFYTLMNSPIFYDKFKEYHTIFEQMR